jgi:hypothetical protein
MEELKILEHFEDICWHSIGYLEVLLFVCEGAVTIL